MLYLVIKVGLGDTLLTKWLMKANAYGSLAVEGPILRRFYAK